MRKLKYLLILSMVAIIAGGILVGCKSTVGVNHELTPYKITYCANGGDLAGKTERYLYVEDGVCVPEPSSDSLISLKPVTRQGYKFVGWVEGKADANGEPVLTDTAKDRADGGVYMNKDGAITAEEARGDDTAQHKYYDYDRQYNTTDGEQELKLWNFKDQRVEKNIVLIAVWENYNKFIVADKIDTDEDGVGDEWEDLTTLLTGNLEIGNEDNELFKKYGDRLYDVTVRSGKAISNASVVDAYDHLRGKKYDNTDPENPKVVETLYTPIEFYFDKECTQKIEFPCDVSQDITVIYYKELKGDYSIVTNTDEFRSALSSGKNIYLNADVTLGSEKTPYNVPNNSTYSGTIEGNNKTITVVSEVTQTMADEGERNGYGSLFGELKNATIRDLKLEIEVYFNIAISPDTIGDDLKKKIYNLNAVQGTELDRTCYLGALARAMSGCTLENVDVVAYCSVKHTVIYTETEWDSEKNLPVDIEIENEFNVNVKYSDNPWSGDEQVAGGSTLTECTISFKDIKDKPAEGDQGDEAGDENSGTDSGDTEGDNSDGGGN